MTSKPALATGGNVTIHGAPLKRRRRIRLLQYGILLYELLSCALRWDEFVNGTCPLTSLVFSHLCLIIVMFFTFVPPLQLARFMVRVAQLLHLR